jgi:hypothetical protein
VLATADQNLGFEEVAQPPGMVSVHMGQDHAADVGGGDVETLELGTDLVLGLDLDPDRVAVGTGASSANSRGRPRQTPRRCRRRSDPPDVRQARPGSGGSVQSPRCQGFEEARQVQSSGPALCLLNHDRACLDRVNPYAYDRSELCARGPAGQAKAGL